MEYEPVEIPPDVGELDSLNSTLKVTTGTDSLVKSINKLDGLKPNMADASEIGATPALGVVTDVKVNGSSVVSGSVATIGVPTQASDIGAATGTALNGLSSKVGKYENVSPKATMNVNASTFSRNSIVHLTSACTIGSVESLDYEVIFDAPAGVSVTLPTSLPIIGEVNNTKRREFSILNGAVVVGNFDPLT